MLGGNMQVVRCHNAGCCCSIVAILAGDLDLSMGNKLG